MPNEQETKQYPKGKHPNSLANLKKGPRFGSGAGNTVDARKANEKSTEKSARNKASRKSRWNWLTLHSKTGKRFGKHWQCDLLRWQQTETFQQSSF